MQPPTIKDITQFFTWFRNYLNSPGGKTALVVLSISTASGLGWGSKRYDDGMEVQKKNDSLEMHRKRQDVIDKDRDIDKLQSRVEALQMKLDTIKEPDCIKILKKADEVKKYVEEKAQSIALQNQNKTKELSELTAQIKNKEQTLNFLTQNSSQ